MWQIVVSFLFLYSLAVSLAQFVKRRVSETFSIAMGIVILGVFVLHSLGIPLDKTFVIVNILIVMFQMGVFVKAILKNTLSQYKPIILSKDSLLLTIFMLSLFWVVRDMYAYHWDEFSHWFFRTKLMFLQKDFGCGPDSALIFQSYPPGSNIIEYYFTAWGDTFSEPNVFYGYNLLCFSFLFPFMLGRSKEIGRILFCVLVPLVLFPEYYNRVLVDAGLGVLFASIVLHIYVKGAEEKFERFQLSILFSILVLLKGTGIGLLILLILFMFFGISKQKTSVKQYVMPMIVAVAVYILWKVYYLIHQGVNSYSVIELNRVTMERVTHIMSSFVKALVSEPIAMLPFVGWFGLFCIMSIVLLCKKKQCHMPICLLIVWIIYMLSLVYTYIFNLSEAEGLVLSSYPRYMSSFVLAVMIIMGYIVLFEIEYHKITIGINLLVMGLIVFLANPSKLWHNIICPVQKVMDSKTQRVPVEYLENALESHGLMNDSHKIGFICQNTVGLQWYMCRYAILPAKLEKCESWSLGEPYYEEDWRTKNVTSEKFEAFLNEIDYLWCYYVDEQFVEKYGSFFENNQEIGNHSLYKVLFIEPEQVCLIKQ